MVIDRITQQNTSTFQSRYRQYTDTLGCWRSWKCLGVVISQNIFYDKLYKFSHLQRQCETPTRAHEMIYDPDHYEGICKTPSHTYLHINVLKATTASRPWRKIPKESIRSPFAHPRLDSVVGLADRVEFDGEAADKTTLSPGRDSRLTPLTAMFGTAQVSRLGTFAIMRNSALKCHSSPYVVSFQAVLLVV